MRIALIYPEVYDIARFYGKRKEFPPFGVLYLASVLENNNFDIQIFTVDSNNTKLDLISFDVIAFSIPSSITYNIIKSVRKNSDIHKDSLLIAGGVHPTIFPKETLIDLDVEIVGVGQGDETIIEIMDNYKSKNFHKISGIYYMKDNEILQTDPRKLKRNLDHLPVIPSRHLLPIEDIIMSDRLSNTSLKMTHLMLTQGCPYSCNFCASQQRQLQYRSPWHIEKELIHLIKTYME